MLLGSVKEALSYGANTFMFYTGAPQNTRRKAIEEMKVEEAKALMAANNIDLKNVVVHAPYIINLANTVKLETFELAVDFLRQELERCAKIGTSILVLHPGSHVKAGEEAGLAQIIKGLNEALQDTPYQGKIALETMAGKGSELGTTFQQIRYLMDHCQYPEKLGVCLDTCHLNDAGYDVTNFDNLLKEFDKIIGLNKIGCIHINDSKNEKGAHKDRHENIGVGKIGFENLIKIIYSKNLKEVPKILETPYISMDGGKDRTYPPYKFEIEMIKNKTYNPKLLEDIRNYYKKS